MSALHETGLELTAELNLNTLLQSIAERALNLIGGKSSNCYIYRPELDLIERVAIAGEELVLGGKTRRRGEGVIGQVWATGAPMLINDYHSWPGRKREFDNFPNRALMAVPVRWGEEFLGVLNILAYVPHRFTEADRDMLGLFAMQAAIAIRNARLYSKIEELSVTDELTGLFNRRGFFQLGEREFERALRFGRPLSALMLDIDHFKRVNDTHGHAGGDQVLRVLADCFRQNTRAIDIAGRYGGEEFALLLPEILQSEAIQIAERLRQSMADLSIPIGSEKGHSSPVDISITVSIGVTALSQDGQSLTDLLDRADHALYRAKDSGRNRVVLEERGNPNP
jgi:diguanylate cyclase (GGDEF)-like protein